MKWLARSAMLMAALSVGGCATAPVSNVSAPAWVSTSTASKQQIWGVYDGLAGTAWSAPNAYTVSYRWAVPGQVLIEEYRHPTSGELAGSNTIIPGATPGTLVLITSVLGNMQWQGTLDVNGTALFARDGILKMPMRLSRTETGGLLQERISLDGTVVTGVDSSTEYRESSQSTASAAAGSVATSLVPPVNQKPQLPEGTQELQLGKKALVTLDEKSLSGWGVRYHLFALPAKKGEEVVVVTECNEVCGFLNAVSSEALMLGFDDKIALPRGSAYQFTLRSDNEVIEVGGRDDLTYTIWVEKGPRAIQLWSDYRASQEAYVQERARQEQEAERLSASSSGGNALMFNAVMTGLSQGLAEGAADYQASQDNQAALLNNIAATAQAVQAQQAATAYEEEAVEESYETPAPTGSSSLEEQQDATVSAALVQARRMAEEAGGSPETFAQLDEAEREMARRQQQHALRKQQAGTNIIYPSKIQLSTATNSITPTANPPEPIAEQSNMAQGKVRLCNRPGDEGPAHWPLCPEYQKKPGQTKGQVPGHSKGDPSGLASTSGGSGMKQTGGGFGSQEPSGPTSGKSWSDEQVTAWCMQDKHKRFKCYGPMGRAWSSYKSIEAALAANSCSEGEGDTPEMGEMNLFDCGRKRSATDGDVPANRPAPW
ncbi:cell pole-organizing protein PopZ [Metapseudomonas resinovorans]|uniref:hypothetical protein n=1 Tax=Metapseudomonas resinovorans TaxID=53412 RepID=UPI003D1FFCE2